MAMKYAGAYRENSVSVVGHANGAIPLTRSTKNICSCKTCFVTGPSQYKFHDEQQKEEKSTLLIQ
jgi:hypothetical protein